jgi:hypothetical protein
MEFVVDKVTMEKVSLRVFFPCQSHWAAAPNWFKYHVGDGQSVRYRSHCHRGTISRRRTNKQIRTGLQWDCHRPFEVRALLIAWRSWIKPQKSSASTTDGSAEIDTEQVMEWRGSKMLRTVCLPTSCSSAQLRIGSMHNVRFNVDMAG